MQRIERLIRYLKDNQFKNKKEVEAWKGKKAKYISPGNYSYEDNTSNTYHIGDWLANSGTTVFLEKEVNIPISWDENIIGILFQAGGKDRKSNCEALLSVQGLPLQGIDRNRNIVMLPSKQLSRKKFSIEVELFNPVGIPEDQLRGSNQVDVAETDPPPIYLEQSYMVQMNKAVQNLIYTLELIRETALLLEPSDHRRSVLIKAMNQIVDRLGFSAKEKLLDTSLLESLESELIKIAESISGYKEGTIAAIGQSHIDVAWLWPIKETIRKTSRTFSSMCTLLEEFGDFSYAQSQPQLFAYLKDAYPEIYSRVKEKIKEGRFEIIGGMWVEPDLNIPLGESLVRQLLYGKQFYKNEFGVESRVEWLPDTFGYCASLPQILKKAETDYFMTTKLNWNDTNRFPYDLFYWEGIDGTKILSYLHTSLGQETNAKVIKETWSDYKQKSDYPERMLVYGHGDGGGGVTREMIERLERASSLPGLPEVRFDTAHGFFDRVQEKDPDLPTWFGDLYLELHRGTYTTQAKTKRYNRLAESLYRDLEIWNSFAYMALGKKYPYSEIKKGWYLLLLNQFHDIIPGTSISEVYKTSNSQYEQLFSIGEKAKEEAMDYIAQAVDTSGSGVPIILFNSLNWQNQEYIKLTGGNELLSKNVVDNDGNIYKTDYIKRDDDGVELISYIDEIPEMGYKTVWIQACDDDNAYLEGDIEFEDRWETAFFIVEFNEDGWIDRLYDKQADKEVIQKGEYANELQLFDDLPTDWDAWDIDPNFASQRISKPRLISKKVLRKGNLSSVLKFEWEINNSVLSQEITFYANSRKIDFKSKVDWKEEHKLLKVSFPINVHTSKATYEIPFGTVERPTHNNTSWEQAQYEVSGQRWADLSEGNYGVSLLNDSKYGYDVKGTTIRLSLLRSPKWPDQFADIGTHEFTYTLFPHRGDWRNSETVKHAHELHSPITIYESAIHTGTLPSMMSFMETRSKSAIIDAIKLSEKGDGVISRIYESEGSETSMTVQCNFDLQYVEEMNLIEKPIKSISVKKRQINEKIKPYEISTFNIVK